MKQQELILTKEQIEILKEYLTRESDNVVCITLDKNSFLKQYNDRRRYKRSLGRHSLSYDISIDEMDGWFAQD